jgi:hypothetical protein
MLGRRSSEKKPYGRVVRREKEETAKAVMEWKYRKGKDVEEYRGVAKRGVEEDLEMLGVMPDWKEIVRRREERVGMW